MAMEAQKKLNHHLPIPFGTWVLVDGNEKEKYQVIDYDVLNDRYNLDLDGAWIWFDANRISVDKDFEQKQPAMSLEPKMSAEHFAKSIFKKLGINIADDLGCQIVDAMDAYANQFSEEQKWLPMESAPLDGTEILAYNSDLEFRKVKYTTYHPDSSGYIEGKREYWWQYINDKDFCHRFRNPIGWQPLPSPPNKEG